jgi:hypothetical protein
MPNQASRETVQSWIKVGKTDSFLNFGNGLEATLWGVNVVPVLAGDVWRHFGSYKLCTSLKAGSRSERPKASYES